MSTHPFRWLPSLQHMANIKIIETLWASSKDMDKLIGITTRQLKMDPDDADPFEAESDEDPDEIYQNDSGMDQPDWSPHILSMTKHLDSAVDQLPLPKTLKTRLKCFLVPMIDHAFIWLQHPHEFREISEKLDNPQLIRHFLKMRWNQTGFLDIRAMLESFAKTKTTTDFKFWDMLCRYCIEDEVIRLGKTINWSSYRHCATYHHIFWYQKIYGTLPTQVFSLFDYWQADEETLKQTNWTMNILTKSLRHALAFQTLVPTIDYHRKELNNEEAFNELVKTWIKKQQSLTNHRPEVVFYILRTLDKADCSAPIFAHYISPKPLLSWPAIWFIDDWISVLEVAPPKFFKFYFECGLQAGDKDLQFKSNDLQMESNIGIYEILNGEDFARELIYGQFRKIWRVFYGRFHMDNVRMRRTFGNIVRRERSRFFAIVFEGLSESERERFMGMYGIEYTSSLVGDARGCLLAIHNALDAGVSRMIESYQLSRLLGTPFEY